MSRYSDLEGADTGISQGKVSMESKVSLSVKDRLKNLLKNNRGFLTALFLMVVVRWSFFDHYRVPTGSMIPTIQIGDDLFVYKMAYNFKVPFTDYILFEIDPLKRGDIVVFKYPKDTSMLFIKRLIGLPGDRIRVQNGMILVNNKNLLKNPEMSTSIEEKLFNTSDTFTYRESLEDKEFTVQRIPDIFRSEDKEFVIPKGHYFFVGDNRDNSADGRVWGLVPHDYIKGKAIRVFYSLSFDDHWVPSFDWRRIGKSLYHD